MKKNRTDSASTIRFQGTKRMEHCHPKTINATMEMGHKEKKRKKASHVSPMRGYKRPVFMTVSQRRLKRGARMALSGAGNGTLKPPQYIAGLNSSGTASCMTGDDLYRSTWISKP